MSALQATQFHLQSPEIPAIGIRNFFYHPVHHDLGVGRNLRPPLHDLGRQPLAILPRGEDIDSVLRLP
jgi:hypothetical protein